MTHQVHAPSRGAKYHGFLNGQYFHTVTARTKANAVEQFTQIAVNAGVVTPSEEFTGLTVRKLLR